MLSRALMTGITLGLLAACGQMSVPTSSVDVADDRPAYVMEVAVSAGDTPVAVGARYRGRVVAFDAARGYAVVGYSEAQRVAARSALRALNLDVEPQPNLNVFEAGSVGIWSGSVGIWSGSVGIWSGGSVGIWSGGSVGIWSGGSVGIWSGGSYSPVPENTGMFQRIELDDAQLSLAPNLGAGVKVAVIDTGLDLSHPAFANSLAPASEWKDFVDDDATPQEGGAEADAGFGHGTAVAGIVLQIAPRATLLPIRALGPNGGGDALNVARAIDHAVAKGAKIINLSLGSAADIQVVRNAVARATAQNVYVVSSAGNANKNAITFPAQLAKHHAFALSVGSVNASDDKSSFSNYQKDNLETVAPGQAVHTTYPNGRRAAWSGTSMAAPIAAGSIALALGQTLKDPGKLSEVGKNLIEKSDDLYNNGQNSAYKDMLGKGRIDLSQFLRETVID